MTIRITYSTRKREDETRFNGWDVDADGESMGWYRSVGEGWTWTKPDGGTMEIGWEHGDAPIREAIRDIVWTRHPEADIVETHPGR